MKKKKDALDFDFSFIGAAIGGVISIAAAESKFDLTDSAIGIILLLMMLPVFSVKKTLYIQTLISLVTGMCLLLVFGVLVEFVHHLIAIKGEHQLIHFCIWLISSLVVFIFLHMKDKKL